MLPQRTGRIYFSAQELTRDHHPDREDERARIEASGGSIIVWGVPRVNGILAMSRSIGDVYLKRSVFQPRQILFLALFFICFGLLHFQ